MPAFLVTGNPGSGKSTLARELARRGFVAVDPDDDPELAHWQDGAGNQADGPQRPDDAWLRSHRWVWSRPRMEEVQAGQEGAVFVCGIARNQDELLDLFERVFLLQIDAPTQEARLAGHDARHPPGRSQAGWQEIRDGRAAFDAKMLRLGAITLDGTTGNHCRPGARCRRLGQSSRERDSRAAIEHGLAGDSEAGPRQDGARGGVVEGRGGAQRGQSVLGDGQLADLPDCPLGQALASGFLVDAESEFRSIAGHVDQVDPSHHGPAVHQDVEVTHAGVLLIQQVAVPFAEMREVVVTSVGNPRAKVGAIVLLEGEQSGGMVEAEALDLGHRGMVSTYGSLLASRFPRPPRLT
jgi:hypothetical protein